MPRLVKAIETAAQRCNLKSAGWLKKNQSMRVVSDENNAQVEFEVLILGDFVIIAHCFDSRLIEEAQNLVENFAKHLRQASGKKVEVEVEVRS